MSTQEIDRALSIRIGDRLRIARGLASHSQGGLAASLGVTFQQVQKYERGTNRISAPMLKRAADFLGQPIDFFLVENPDGELGEQLRSLEGLDPGAIEIARRVATLSTHQRQSVVGVIEAIERSRGDRAA